MAAVDFGVMGRLSPLPVKNGDSSAVILAAAASGEILISEPFAKRFGKAVGDILVLATPSGLQEFRVAGEFTDYTTDQGLVLIHWPEFQKHWPDERPQSLAIYLGDGQSSEDIISQLRSHLANSGDYLIYSNEKLRTEVLRIFDQTFSVTGVLQTIGVLVAAVGVFLTATLLGMERQRELGVLRAIGFSRNQVEKILRGESVLIGIFGGLLGIICGLCLAVLLMQVINVAYFGWTVSWATPWVLLVVIVPASVASCWLAAWYPARRAAFVEIASAVRSE